MFFKYRKYNKIIEKINYLNEDYNLFSKKDFQNKTKQMKQYLSNLNNDNDKQNYLNSILPECFAMVREVSSRVLGLRHFDVQLMGGIIIHEGNVAEMKTGEGKTLVITLSAYLNALLGKGVHVITVNDYLAKRDKEQMSKIYEYLGLSVGLIQQSMSTEERRLNYNCDITYVTNSELGFDYLRDNMINNNEKKVLSKGLYYAIVDEVDSILIDEARTPLIISKLDEPSLYLYNKANDFIKTLKIEYKIEEEVSSLAKSFLEKIELDCDAVIDRKDKQVMLTSKGSLKMEQYFNVDNINEDNSIILQHVLLALKANYVFQKDKDYLIRNDKLLIIDEFTGRILEGRQYNEGLHQAIEAKENIPLSYESKTLATITYQNLFRLYYKLSGMTGTAKTEEDEFKDIYNLKVIEVPTNKPIIRLDHNDRIFLSKIDKYNSIINHIKLEHSKGRPILVGTPSIEISEIISDLLSKENIPHNVLNAKFIEQEADIISHAGQINTVTVATNMAGRGTDIVLSEECKSLGGLLVIGVERNISRRIDNQLIGRAGRQGDMGESVFYVSFEDDLLDLFGGNKIKDIFNKFSNNGMVLGEGLFSKTIKKAQKQVEGLNYEIRKNLLKYDDILSKQRDIIYNDRDNIICKDLETILVEICESSFSLLNNDFDKLKNINSNLNIELNELNLSKILTNNIKYEKEDIIKEKMLSIVDEKWIDYIQIINELKKGIEFQSYKQQDPIIYFINETDKLFSKLVLDIDIKIIEYIISLKK